MTEDDKVRETRRDDAMARRRQRQAEALRRNLARRKAQRRARDETPTQTGTKPAPGARDRS